MRPRPQRTASLAIALGLALPALSACRSQPASGARASLSPSPGPSRPTMVGTQLPPATPAPSEVPVVPQAQALLRDADPTDASAVARVFARDSWSFDTAEVSSQAAAEARLSALMTPSLAAETAASSQALPTSLFRTWQSHHVVTTVQVAQTHDSGAPPDTATSAYRSFAVTVSPHAADGWVGPPFLDVEFLTLSRPGPGDPWRVAQVS